MKLSSRKQLTKEAARELQRIRKLAGLNTLNEAQIPENELKKVVDWLNRALPLAIESETAQVTYRNVIKDYYEIRLDPRSLNRKFNDPSSDNINLDLYDEEFNKTAKIVVSKFKERMSELTKELKSLESNRTEIENIIKKV